MLGWILGVIAVFLLFGYFRMPVIWWTLAGGLMAVYLSVIAGFGFMADVVLGFVFEWFDRRFLKDLS